MDFRSLTVKPMSNILLTMVTVVGMPRHPARTSPNYFPAPGNKRFDYTSHSFPIYVASHANHSKAEWKKCCPISFVITAICPGSWQHRQRLHSHVTLHKIMPTFNPLPSSHGSQNLSLLPVWPQMWVWDGRRKINRKWMSRGSRGRKRREG